MYTVVKFGLTTPHTECYYAKYLISFHLPFIQQVKILTLPTARFKTATLISEEFINQVAQV